MKRKYFLVLALVLSIVLCTEAVMAQKAYEMIKWNSPKAINERISGDTYVLPDGWKEATEGVKKIKMSNFGALSHDPATVANAARFQELTGIEVEVLAWAEAPIVAKTISIFAAKSGAVDILCYDHPTTYMQMVAGNWLHPIDAIWDDPEVWKYFASPLKEGLTAPDGKIYGSIGQTKTMMLYYRPSVVPEPPKTWQELKEIAKNVTTPEMPGFMFSAGGEMDVMYPFRAMVYSQGGRIVDKERQRLVMNSPEGQKAWQMLADMVLVDKSAPTSVLEYDWMQVADLFGVGKSAMIITHTVDANRFQNPDNAPAIQGDWAVAAAPKWDDSMPDDYMATYFDVDGYMINTFINDNQKAAAMLYLDFARSYEASYRELIDEGNEAAVLTVYDSPAAQKIPVPAARQAAMKNAVLETFPPAGRSLTDVVQEFFAYVVSGEKEPMAALEECQALLDDYAVPE